MKILELFCGTKSFSKIAEKHGHECVTVDNNPEFKPDLDYDLLNIHCQNVIITTVPLMDFVWMSPPCTTFSMASGNTHWTKDREPKTESAKVGLELLDRCRILAEYCIKFNKVFFIENPNGRAVWFLPDEWLKRVWYCQYGDKRAKPTNIWTNADITFKTCKNGDPNCNHERAPRGSKTGTQGLKGAKERSVIPPKLFEFIFEVIDNG